MKLSKKVLDFEYVERIEGHLKFTVDTEKDIVQVEPLEGARLFESFLRGRKWDEIPYIASRICGICPCSHNICAVKAVENGFGVESSEDTIKLRKLVHYGELLQSHLLHLYFLALPDYMGCKDIFEIAKKDPETVKTILKLRNNAIYMADIVGGRFVHPMATAVGGFNRIPKKREIEMMLKNMKECVNAAERVVETFSKLDYPKFERRTEYVALRNGKEYGLYDGKVISSDGLDVEGGRYGKTFDEIVKPYSTAKFSYRKGHSFCVGALSRVNLNKDMLSDRAKEAIKTYGCKFPSYNPHHINIAQAIEVIHCVEKSIEVLEELKEKGINAKKVEVKPKEGIGASVVEAPRG
ncbi:hypothetical protein DRN63_03900, partial [Nanoarchaeota archaeon]